MAQPCIVRFSDVLATYVFSRSLPDSAIRASTPLRT
jgi:hypothetical protein